jgi:hypothetical protein
MPDTNYILEAQQIGLEFKSIQKVAQRWGISLNDAAELMVNFEKQQGYYKLKQQKLHFKLILEGKSLLGKMDKKEYKLMIEGPVVHRPASTENKNSIDSYDRESLPHRRLNTIDLTDSFLMENPINSDIKIGDKDTNRKFANINSDIRMSDIDNDNDNDNDKKLPNINSDTNLSDIDSYPVFYDTSISSNETSNCKKSHSETSSELNRRSHSETSSELNRRSHSETSSELNRRSHSATSSELNRRSHSATGSNKTGSELDRISNESIHLNNIDNDRHLDSTNILNNVENYLTTSTKIEQLSINSKSKLLNKSNTQQTNRSYFKRVSICCCF